MPKSLEEQNQEEILRKAKIHEKRLASLALARKAREEKKRKAETIEPVQTVERRENEIPSEKVVIESIPVEPVYKRIQKKDLFSFQETEPEEDDEILSEEEEPSKTVGEGIPVSQIQEPKKNTSSTTERGKKIISRIWNGIVPTLPEDPDDMLVQAGTKLLFGLGFVVFILSKAHLQRAIITNTLGPPNHGSFSPPNALPNLPNPGPMPIPAGASDFSAFTKNKRR